MYDQNVNLTGRLDSDGGIDETRTMAYDALDRLVYTDAPGVLGTAAYAYDALDNLREIDFAGGVRAPETHVYHHDGLNRLSQIHRTNGPQHQYVTTRRALDGARLATSGRARQRRLLPA